MNTFIFDLIVIVIKKVKTNIITKDMTEGILYII